jgi:hypothetical protein
MTNKKIPRLHHCKRGIIFLLDFPEKLKTHPHKSPLLGTVIYTYSVTPTSRIIILIFRVCDKYFRPLYQ